MKNIIYIGDFDCVNMNVQAQLVINNAKVFSNLGYRVILIGTNTKRTRYEKVFKEMNVYSNIEYYEVLKIASVKSIIYLVKNCRIVNKITKKYINETKFAISYQMPGNIIVFLYFLFLVKKNNIKYITNCADLPIINERNLSLRFIKKINWKLMEIVNYKCSDGIIAVSNYIAKFYYKKNRPYIIIPPLIDSKQNNIKVIRKQLPIIFMYNGYPFPKNAIINNVSLFKDRLDIVIELFYELYNMKYQFILKIFGIKKDEYITILPKHKSILNIMRDSILFLGKYEKGKEKQIYENVDFCINVRSKNRMTEAGVSTKMVESLSYGIPYITNNVGDIKKYIVNNKNGFILPEEKEKSVIVLENILKMSIEEICKMKNYTISQNQFYYKNYQECIDSFLLEVVR